MFAYFYTSLEIAVIVSGMDLDCREASAVLDRIWDGEQRYLCPLYDNKRKFILEVRYWMHYLYEKQLLDEEFSAIQTNLLHSNYSLRKDQFMSDYSNLDLFFKNTRIRILYGTGRHYVRIKLRTLLKQYGYKRRSKILVEQINDCLDYYQLKISLRGGVSCTIEDINLDDMIIFSIKQ